MSKTAITNNTDPQIFFLTTPVPHPYLFSLVSGTIHHGGAGTTHTALRAGKPTLVVPFFGDQFFWADAVHFSVKAGPRPIPAKELSVENLRAAIEDLTGNEEWKIGAEKVGERMRAEDGKDGKEGDDDETVINWVGNSRINGNGNGHKHEDDGGVVERAVRSVEEGLMRTMWRAEKTVGWSCEVSPPEQQRVGVWRVRKGKMKGLRLSSVAVAALRKAKVLNGDDLEMSPLCVYDVVGSGPLEPMSGASGALGDLFYESFKGMGEIVWDVVRVPQLGYSGLKQVEQRMRDGDSIKGKEKEKNEFNDYDGFDDETASQKSRHRIPGTLVAKGMGRILKATARSPGAFSLAMSKGAHNLPKLYGDQTVRPQAKITGVGSGLKEGVKVRHHHLVTVYDVGRLTQCRNLHLAYPMDCLVSSLSQSKE